jgi:hypothetical protein
MQWRNLSCSAAQMTSDLLVAWVVRFLVLLPESVTTAVVSGSTQDPFHLYCGDSVNSCRCYKTPAAYTHSTIEQRGYAKRRGKHASTIGYVFCVVRAEDCLKTVHTRVKLRVQLWSVNQQATEAEQSWLLRFVTRKRLVKTLKGIAIVEELLPSND